MSKFTVCPPIVTGVKYCESFPVGEADTTPSLAAAAATTSSGAVLPNLLNVDKTAAGPDWMNSFGTSLWCIVNAFFAKSRCSTSSSSIGEAAAMLINKAEAAADSCWVKRMMMRAFNFGGIQEKSNCSGLVMEREPLLEKHGKMGRTDDDILETGGKKALFIGEYAFSLR